MASASASTAKAFTSQVRQAARTSQGATPTVHGTDCARFWLQGIVVSVTTDGSRFVLDDGTGTVQVDARTFLKSIPGGMASPVLSGDLVMVIGPLVRKSSSSLLSPSDPESDAVHTIIAHQVMNVSQQPQQDAIWFLEVVEYWTAAMR